MNHIGKKGNTFSRLHSQIKVGDIFFTAVRCISLISTTTLFALNNKYYTELTCMSLARNKTWIIWLKNEIKEADTCLLCSLWYLWTSLGIVLNWGHVSVRLSCWGRVLTRRVVIHRHLWKTRKTKNVLWNIWSCTTKHTPIQYANIWKAESYIFLSFESLLII